MRCLDVPEVTHHKERLQYPMKRAREDRGLDKWERISWTRPTTSSPTSSWP
ncbi:MAG: hypothetical protein V8S24_16420 [Gordonibacter pamelaeae]